METDGDSLEEAPDGGANERGSASSPGPSAHGAEAVGAGGGDDGVPRVVLPARVQRGVLDGGKEDEKACRRAGEAGRVRADGLGAAGEAVAGGRVAEAPEEVEG